MELSTLIGLVGCFSLMLFGIVSGDAGFSAISSFLDPASALITFGGAFMAVLAMSPNIGQYVNSLKSFGLVLKPINSSEDETIKTVINLSNVARKEGLLALEEAANGIEDEFMKKGVLLIVDGTDPELVRSILETELSCVEQRHKDIIGFWENLASMGPAWGMIGTLIGLINMLGNLSDISTVGPNMAVALITTLYGSLLANWIATPAATKLKVYNSIEIQTKSVMVEGLLSIQAGENPRVIEEKLKSFLSPARRKEFSADSSEGGAAE